MNTILQIGQAIRKARIDKRLTGVALANACGINRNTLNELERGVGNVQLNTLLSICHQLGMELSLNPVELSGMATELSAKPSPLAKRLAARLNQHKSTKEPK